jgi:hypothetical protein
MGIRVPCRVVLGRSLQRCMTALYGTSQKDCQLALYGALLASVAISCCCIDRVKSIWSSLCVFCFTGCSVGRQWCAESTVYATGSASIPLQPDRHRCSLRCPTTG